MDTTTTNEDATEARQEQWRVMWIVKVWRKIWNSDFYVCKYRIEGVEAGRFAALGETREEALGDAKGYVERRFTGEAEYEIDLHRPTLYQRINAALRST